MERIGLNQILNRGYGLPGAPLVWPHTLPNFLSPILPIPNVPLPYSIPGAQPIPPIPLYQNLANNAVPANTLSSNANLTLDNFQGNIKPYAFQKKRPNNNNNKPITKPLEKNIKKNENVVTKSVTDDATSIKMLSNDNTTSNKTTETKTSSLLYDSNASNKDSKIISHGADGNQNEDEDSAQSVKRALILLSPLKFNELARLALKGSEIAEKLAFAHRNRPCFKKIDNLCARVKQDLFRPDAVLPNINSQGVAWAVKDFIFVFTRVINAWIIIRGYVYNTPEELNKIKQAFSPEFLTSFATWQDSTLVFIENLIKSFISLDRLSQSQKSAYQKIESDSCSTIARCSSLSEDSFGFLSASIEKVDSDLSNKYLLTIVKDSEDSQRQATVNGTYFKTGTYKPIKKGDTLLDNQASSSTWSTSSSGSGGDGQTPVSNLSVPTFSSQTTDGNSDLQQYLGIWSPTESNNKSEMNILDTIKLNGAKYIDNWLTYDLRLLEENEQQMEDQETGKNLTGKLNTIIDHLMSMKTADLFFKLQFTKNYFPEFVAKQNSDFMDVRSIILKCQVGDYKNIYEVVHDIRKIIYAGKEFLKFNQDHKLCNSIKAFEAEINILLTQPPFKCYNFDHIKGEPDESLI